MSVLLAALPDAKPIAGCTPDVFRDRIVLIGASVAGAFDVKSSPVSPEIYPGTEMQATAISNLLENQRALPLNVIVTLLVAFIGATIAAAGTLIPRPRSSNCSARRWPSLERC